jgi:ectoine hydroxylase-related dioxygenase (phytanoyl-CoA dioxygenase family)
MRNPHNDYQVGHHDTEQGFYHTKFLYDALLRVIILRDNGDQTGGGEIYCGHLATWVALADVPAGTGFCVVPGSHRSAFQAPEKLSFAAGAPLVAAVAPLRAGDVVVFSTALLHQAAPWTVLERPRLNVFQVGHRDKHGAGVLCMQYVILI